MRSPSSHGIQPQGRAMVVVLSLLWAAWVSDTSSSPCCCLAFVVSSKPSQRGRRSDTQQSDRRIDKRLYRKLGSSAHVRLATTPSQSSSSSSQPTSSSDDDSASFEAILVDLEQRGVTLLSCDASQVHTLQAALWSSLAQLSEKEGEQAVCLIFPPANNAPGSIPTKALQAFCHDFYLAQSKPNMQRHLPELNRLSVSLVQQKQQSQLPNENNPRAVLLEAQARSDAEKDDATIIQQQWATWASQLKESNCRAALQAFVDRVVVGRHVCPYMKSAQDASTGKVVYRYSNTPDACAGLAEFWTCLVELLGTPPDELSSTVLSLPGIAPLHPQQLQENNTISNTHDRFAAFVELASQSLCLYKADDVFSLVHFHPLYTRSWIEPRDRPAYGHLPPQGWLRSMMMQHSPEMRAAQESITPDDEQLELSNYQRRAPHTAINILRVAQLEDSTNSNLNIVDLQLPDGRVEKASGLTTYSRNAVTMAETGREALEEAVARDLTLQDASLWG